MANLGQEEYESVSLHFACRDLVKNMSESLVVIRVSGYHNKNISGVLGSTEEHMTEKKVDFVQSVDVDFIFEKKQTMIAQVFEKSNNGDGFHLIGSAIFDLSEVVGSLENLKIYHIENYDKRIMGKIVIRSERSTSGSQYNLSFDLAIRGIPKFSCFSSRNYFLKFYKRLKPENKGSTLNPNYEIQQEASKKWLLVSCSPVCRGKSDYILSNCAISGHKLCGNNLNTDFKIELWKYKANSEDYIMGFVKPMIPDLVAGKDIYEMSMSKNVNPPIVTIKNFKYTETFAFIDYIRGGLCMNLIVGIDFTASNRDPNDPSSLHFLGVNRLNLYQSSILSVGEILEDYNHTNRIYTFGFGAKIGEPPLINHCFPLNFNNQTPYFQNFKELFDCYKRSIFEMRFSGPTLFAPLLMTVIDFAERKYHENSQNYTTLLLLTDGVTHDLQQSIDLVVRASKLPISIIIIGIGNENFDNMRILDADDNPLFNTAGEKSHADILQFVPYNQFMNDPFVLRTEVLKELPGQVVDFYRRMGIKPQPQEYTIQRNLTSDGRWDREVLNGGGVQNSNYPTLDSKFL